MIVKGKLVDILNERIFNAEVEIEGGKIVSVAETVSDVPDFYIMPGFIDAHVHIESSLLVPSEFARLAVLHGTVATVSDPHEIANVCGIEGVEFMINNASTVPFHFFFGAPSCVPATQFETAGARLNATDTDKLLQKKEILYLSEMMNFPGVLHADKEVMQKIKSSLALGKPVDGHAPGLRGSELDTYVAAGITTDHECFTLEEAEEKLSKGMKILIREGSAARNFDALSPLVDHYPDSVMFCSDDKHPDGLLVSHINGLVARSVALGYNLFHVLKAACINPVLHYNLSVGLLRQGDPADFILVNDLTRFSVAETWVKGCLVSKNGQSLIESSEVVPINNFSCQEIEESLIFHQPTDMQPVIVCMDGELITERIDLPASDCTPSNDVLKLVVVNRYTKAKPAVGYIRKFGLKSGAIASSVAHDSHNIIAVGVSDKEICQAINAVIRNKGGLAASESETLHVLPLPVAGLMSKGDGFKIAEEYSFLHNFAVNHLGSGLKAPFMSLSFMALLVIPHLKLSDKGLFNGDSFSFV